MILGLCFKKSGCVSSRSLFGKTVNMASLADGVLGSDCTRRPWFVQRPKIANPIWVAVKDLKLPKNGNPIT